MHDDMVKILELFINLKTIFNAQKGQLIQVKSTKARKSTENDLDMLQYRGRSY
jgi:hypothetical protein